MDFKEALSHLENGKTIRRKAWDEKKCLKASEGIFRTLCFTSEDVKADDWETIGVDDKVAFDQSDGRKEKEITISKSEFKDIALHKIAKLAANKDISFPSSILLTAFAADIAQILFEAKEDEKNDK